jgi:hypothetical protein
VDRLAAGTPDVRTALGIEPIIIDPSGLVALVRSPVADRRKDRSPVDHDGVVFGLGSRQLLRSFRIEPTCEDDSRHDI